MVGTVRIELTKRSITAINKKIAQLQNKRSVLKKIADQEVKETRQRIRTTKVSPDGIPWAPWRPSTLRHRIRRGTTGGGLLYETGKLWRSITGVVYKTRISVRARKIYATYLQHGTNRMVARPFLGFSERSKTRIKNLLKVFVKKKVR